MKTFLNRGEPALDPITGKEEHGVKYILGRNDGTSDPLDKDTDTPDQSPSTDPAPPNKGPALPVEKPPMPAIGGNTEPPASDTRPISLPVDGGIEALAVLEKFLEMETLEERLPLIVTNRQMPELQSSVLNAPLPKEPRIEVDVKVPTALEQVMDYYYRVYFTPVGDSPPPPPQTMLVRSRGTSPPKVVVDPFLDLYGGRFARFAENPVKNGGEHFQVVVSAVPSCNDDVPGPEKKQTLKILTADNTKEIGKAYFGKTSLVVDILMNENSGFSYGQAKPCTVFLRWNTEEDPEKPYIEALDITALDWNQ